MDMRIVRFLKDWTLIISILAGIFGYFIYTGIPALEPTRAAANRAVAIVQPLLIFAMLFLTFCKVDPQGKAFAQMLLDLEVDVPRAVLEATP